MKSVALCYSLSCIHMCFDKLESSLYPATAMVRTRQSVTKDNDEYSISILTLHLDTSLKAYHDGHFSRAPRSVFSTKPKTALSSLPFSPPVPSATTTHIRIPAHRFRHPLHNVQHCHHHRRSSYPGRIPYGSPRRDYSGAKGDCQGSPG